MAIPDYQSFMLPLLGYAGDSQVHSIGDARHYLAEYFALSPNDIQELLPSGRMPVFNSRVGWAATYLRQAQLLKSVGRGQFQITKQGLEVLVSLPADLTAKYLTRFPEFRAFLSTHREKASETKNDDAMKAASPEERIEAAFQAWRNSFAADLLERLHTCLPGFFEQIVLDLLLAMGYGGSRREAAAAVGRSGDGGIDGIINEDKLGLDAIYVQAKRWDGPVGSPTVSAFVGALVGKHANKGVLITTSSFSQPAIEFVKSVGMKVILIDGPRLADLMIEYGIGVTSTATYTLKRIDEDYFES